MEEKEPKYKIAIEVGGISGGAFFSNAGNSKEALKKWARTHNIWGDVYITAQNGEREEYALRNNKLHRKRGKGGERNYEC